MLRKLLVIVLSGLWASASALPTTAPATYDQRQDGDLNVKVDLDNFVILVARPSSSFDVLGSMAQLFALDSKHNFAGGSGPSDEVQAVIPEAKNAAAEHHQEEEEEKQQPKEEVSLENVSMDAGKVAGKPEEDKTLVLLQQGDKTARSLEDIVRTLRNLKGKETPVLGEQGAKEAPTKGHSGKYKFVESVEEPQSLKLVGDAVENCGPGRSRDRMGICQGDGLANE